MSVQPAPTAGPALRGLFTPGIRLGWSFRDLRTLTAPFRDPEPDPDKTRRQTAARAAAAEASYARARRWLVKPSLVLGLVLLLLAGYDEGRHRGATAALMLIAAVAVCGSGLGYTARGWWRRHRTAGAEPEQEFHQALKKWHERATAHQEAELTRLGSVPEWASAEPPTRRTDVFGGSLAGWQGLLTVHGASLLAGQPLLVMDLSGQLASCGLSAAVRAGLAPTGRSTCGCSSN